MLVKMAKGATPEQIAAVEEKLHGWGYTTGKMAGEEITLIGAYGDITRLPQGEIQEMGGSRASSQSHDPINEPHRKVLLAALFIIP